MHLLGKPPVPTTDRFAEGYEGSSSPVETGALVSDGNLEVKTGKLFSHRGSCGADLDDEPAWPDLAVEAGRSADCHLVGRAAVGIVDLDAVRSVSIRLSNVPHSGVP